MYDFTCYMLYIKGVFLFASLRLSVLNMKYVERNKFVICSLRLSVCKSFTYVSFHP